MLVLCGSLCFFLFPIELPITSGSSCIISRRGLNFAVLDHKFLQGLGDELKRKGLEKQGMSQKLQD